MRLADRMDTSWSLYSFRRISPSPVEARHIASDSQSGMADTLSMAAISAAFTAMIQSVSSLGTARVGAALGSMRLRSIRVAHVLAVPSRPVRRAMTCPMSGQR
jgi:hypothetical protein